MENNVNKTTVAPTEPALARPIYLDWSAVSGGVALSGAISLLLLQFGAGVGLSLGSPILENGGASWNVIVAGLWLAVAALASSSAGGYVAGRMRSRWNDAVPDEVEFRDGVHGLVVWSVSTLGVAFITVLVTGLVGAGFDAGDAEPTAEVLRITGNVSVIYAFATAAGASLGAGAAWFAAIEGGKHRDEGTSVHGLVPAAFRRKTI